MMEVMEVQVMDVNVHDYVNVLEVAEDKVEECVCSKCGVSYFRVKGSYMAKTVCKKCLCENRRKQRKILPYTIQDGIATFTTHKGDTFTVDEEDAEIVSQYCWCVNNSTGYLQGRVTGKLVYLHRFILGVESDKNLIVDHINHDILNNCRSNLRICSYQENNRNRKDVKGIYKNSNNTYQAYIAVDGEKIHLGTYESEQMARAVRLIAEKVYFGEFSSNVDLFNDPELVRLYEEALTNNKHYHQNETRIDGDVVYVTASSKEFVIDLEDYEKMKDYKWHNDRGRIRTWINGEHQLLTRFLMGLTKADKNKRVKFIDGDKFNFRRENLEVIEFKTKSKNQD